jgi:hypothetical protein
MYVKTLACAIVALAFGASSVAQALGAVSPKFLPGHQLFMKSAEESSDLSEVRLPTYRGTDPQGNPVWFVVTDASSKKWADQLGVNFSPKLANTIDTGAVMHAAWNGGQPSLPFTPDFSPVRLVKAGAPGATCPPGQSSSRAIDGLPVDCFRPGADGSYGQNLITATGTNSYSPLLQIDTPDGPVVLDAPHVANNSGYGDKVIRLEGSRVPGGHVLYVLTAGLYDGHTVHYVSFDSSIPILAALEGITFAPALNRSPSTPHNDTVAGTARSGLIAFTNGPEGLGNPQRQGINSAVHDGASTPLNVIQFTPNDFDPFGQTLYSPLWDVHLATWQPGATKTRQTDFDAILANPQIQAPDGTGPVHPVKFWMVTCPLVSTDGEGVFVVPPPT